MSKEIIKRNFPATFRADESDSGLIVGVPIVFNTPTDIGGYFEEEISPDAITDELLTKSDIGFYFNHNINEKRLARSIIPLDKKGGMTLVKKDYKYVEAQVRLNLDRSDANDMYLAIQDGTVDGMSFMFGVEEDRWERLDTDYPKRIITKISPIVEISAVNYPAYKTTNIHTARADISTEIDIRAKEIACKQLASVNARKEQEKRELELLKIKANILYK